MTIQTLNTITESDKLLLKKGDFIVDTMLLVSSTFNNSNTLIKNEEGYTLTHNGEINLDNYLVLTINDSIKNWEEVEDRYKEDEGFIGQFISRTLTGELQNITNDFNIENQYVVLLMGIKKLVKNNTSTTTWYSLGTFLIQKPEDDDVKDNTKYESLDIATLFNKPFDAMYTNDTYITSFKDKLANGEYFEARELAIYTCNQVGVTFDATYNFPNYNFKIYSNQFTEGDTCRDVMKYLSKLAYGWCEIGWDDVCRITNIKSNTQNINDIDKLTNDDYYSLTTQKNVYGPVNSVYVGLSNVEGEGYEKIKPDPLPDGAKKIQVQVLDNPITYTYELRASALNGNQADSLFGLSYTPIEMETPCHVWWKGDEPIEIKQMDNSLIYTYPFNRTISYNGNIKTKIYSYAKTNAEVENGYKDDVVSVLKNTRFIVDKQQGQITLNASNITSQGEVIEGVQQTITAQEARIKVISTNIDADGNVTAVRTENGFTFDKNGLNIYTSENSYNTQINNVGTYYRDGNNDIVKTTKDGSTIVNLNEQGLHQYSYDGYGEYGFVDERTEVDGEYCYATFYNRE